MASLILLASSSRSCILRSSVRGAEVLWSMSGVSWVHSNEFSISSCCSVGDGMLSGIEWQLVGILSCNINMEIARHTRKARTAIDARQRCDPDLPVEALLLLLLSLVSAAHAAPETGSFSSAASKTAVCGICKRVRPEPSSEVLSLPVWDIEGIKKKELTLSFFARCKEKKSKIVYSFRFLKKAKQKDQRHVTLT